MLSEKIGAHDNRTGILLFLGPEVTPLRRRAAALRGPSAKKAPRPERKIFTEDGPFILQAHFCENGWVPGMAALSTELYNFE